MYNPDVPTQPLILPATDIDLSQTIDYKSGIAGAPSYSPSSNEVREAIQQLIAGLQQATAGTFELQDAKLKSITDNTNAALNDLDRRSEGTNQMHYELKSVVHSFLLLNLLAEKMPEEVRQHHEGVIATFLNENAVLSDEPILLKTND